MNSEITALAELAIANKFFHAFHKLAAEYVALGKGLNEERLIGRLSQAHIYNPPTTCALRKP